MHPTVPHLEVFHWGKGPCPLSHFSWRMSNRRLTYVRNIGLVNIGFLLNGQWTRLVPSHPTDGWLWPTTTPIRKDGRGLVDTGGQFGWGESMLAGRRYHYTVWRTLPFFSAAGFIYRWQRARGEYFVGNLHLWSHTYLTIGSDEFGQLWLKWSVSSLQSRPSKIHPPPSTIQIRN